MPAADTTIDVARRQRAVIASKSPAERADMAIEMSRMVRELALEGIRRRHPGIGQRETMLRLVERLHGPALAEAVEASILPQRGR